MARPVDRQRRESLLEAAAEHVRRHGISGLSFRTLADALGVTTTTLVHHFGTKQTLTAAVMNRIREDLLAAALGSDRDSGADVSWKVWRWATSEAHEQLFRSFFEVYGFALMRPDEHHAFLQRVVDDWLEPTTARLQKRGAAGSEAEARATLGLAVVRGLLLDYLTTGDRQRVEAALELFSER